MTRGRPLPRPWAGPLGLYRPGRTPLHRVPAGPKLVGLTVFSLVTALVPSLAAAVGRTPAAAPRAAGCVAVVAAALAASVRVPWRSWRGALAVALVVGAGRAWTGSAAAGPAVGVAAGLTAGLVVLALVLAGATVVAATPPGDVLDALTRAARPLRRAGVDPDRAALAAVLMVRAVPALAGTLAATREAARARGCERDPRTWLTPAAVRAVARAHATGEALAARGLGGD